MLSYKHIPNIITSLNLLAGCTGIAMLMQGQIYYATVFIFIAVIFDFLDGTAARLLNSKSELGKQLDSLADVVSFGVLPGLIMYRLLDHAVDFQYPEVSWMLILPYLALLIPVASAIRLGRFNLDTRQSENFIGLPTPANALFLAGLPLLLTSHGLIGKIIMLKLMNFLFDPFLLAAICLLSAIMLNAEVPLFSLKFKNFSWKENNYKYILLVICIILLFFLQFTAFLAIIPVYIILSMVFRKRFWQNQGE
ncbi:MAG: CDP-diacylglycerol--serine O-phosphatidyltransferase [Bacteroidales bacterium]